MADTLEQLELILLPSLLHNLLRPLPLLGRERMVVFRAREQKRLCKIAKLLVSKGAGVCKGTRRNKAVNSQRIEHVWGAEAVADTTVFGLFLAVLLSNRFCPFWHCGSGEADVLVSPRCLVKPWVCGLVVFVFSVLPNRILPLLDVSQEIGSCTSLK